MRAFGLASAPVILFSVAPLWMTSSVFTPPNLPSVAPVPAVDASIPISRLVGRYLLVRHKTDPLPALVHADVIYHETLMSGTIDIRRDSTFTLRYIIRTTLHAKDETSDEATELTGRLNTTRAGLRLTVLSENGERGEEPWFAAATATAGAITVSFEDDNVEQMTFRRR